MIRKQLPSNLKFVVFQQNTWLTDQVESEKSNLVLLAMWCRSGFKRNEIKKNRDFRDFFIVFIDKADKLIPPNLKKRRLSSFFSETISKRWFVGSEIALPDQILIIIGQSTNNLAFFQWSHFWCWFWCELRVGVVPLPMRWTMEMSDLATASHYLLYHPELFTIIVCFTFLNNSFLRQSLQKYNLKVQKLQ